MATGFVFHERCMWHDAGNSALFVPSGGAVQPDQHAEEPETKRRIRNLLEVSGLLSELSEIKAQAASYDQVLRVHARDYVDRVQAQSAAMGAPPAPILSFPPMAMKSPFSRRAGVSASSMRS